jgi:Uma2 family endonuclease
MEVYDEEDWMERPVATAARKLTHADFLLLPEDGQRHELVDGEHFVSPGPRVRHQRIVGELYFALATWLRSGGSGELLLSPMDVILSDHDVVEPDLVYLRAESPATVSDWVRGVPELLVEVLSPTSRHHDEVRKRALYERFGVAEYWLVDPEAETVKVYRLEGGRFARPLLLSRAEGDVLISPLLPGLQLVLDALFPAG